MRKEKQYQQVEKKRFLPEVTHCITCQTRLRKYATVSQRTIITLHGPLQMTHVGYRCPNANCSGKAKVYRSALADAQALPGFSFGLDIVALVGHLKLHQHQTVDEVHREVNERLKDYQISMSRRNVMYLFEAYSALLKAAAQNTSDPVFQDWLGQVRLDGGLILSIDGIQPDKGNETIYLVREVSTGRLLTAQNVMASDTETIKQVLSPVLALDVPVIGVISDAQQSLRDAISALWCIVFPLWHLGEYFTSKSSKERSACLINCQKEQMSKQAFVSLFDTGSKQRTIPLPERLLSEAIEQVVMLFEDT